MAGFESTPEPQKNEMMEQSTSSSAKQQQGSNGSTNSSTTMTNKKKKNATTTTTPYQSKRQRRAAGPNPSNTWQQQPKIKSAGARAKAYIKYAGLANEQNYSVINTNNNNTSTTTTAPTSAQLLDPQLELDSPEIKFGRLLGGTDQRTRHGAVQMLRAYLSSRADFTIGGMGLSELDLLKLWKGLWYTLYMADKAPVQDRLSKILAELMWSVAGTVEEDEYAGNVYLQMQEDVGFADDILDEYDDEYDTMEGSDEEEYDDNDNGYEDGMYIDNDGDIMQIVEMNSNSSDDDDDYDDDDDDDEASEDGIDLDEIGENEIYEVDQTDSEDDDEEESNSDDDDENPTLKFLAGSDGDDDEFNNEDDEYDEFDEEQQRIQDMNEKHCRGAHLVSLYISTFLCTVRREWGNVDKHRVDKFYTAVRFMISEAYKYMSKRNWNIGIIQLLNDAIYNEGLAAETSGLTNGLRYHLIDICIDELAKVNRESALPLTEATFLDCLEPFFGLAQRAVDKNVQQRVMQNVLLKFLNEYSVVCAAAAAPTEDGEDKDTDDSASLIFRQVHVGTVSKFIFSIASDSETDERYRKSLYEMHKAYTRQIRLAGMDVDIDDHNSEEEDEEEYESETEGNDFCNTEDEMQGNTRKEDILKEKSNIKDEVAVPIEQGKSLNTDVPSGQKKKRKKKNKTEKAEENGIANAPAGADVKAIDHEPETKSLSKNKRKEKQNGVKSEATEVKTSIPVSEKVVKTEESTTPVTKSSKKKRKLQNVNESTDDDITEEDFITTHVETPSVNASKKKKNKKQQTSPPSVDPRAMPSPDQATFEEELGGMSDDNDGRASPSKRVSFGAVNRAKSHKASMKAIKTLDKSRWDTATRTPDKGILHPRIALMSSEKKKARAPLSQLSSSKKKGKRS